MAEYSILRDFMGDEFATALLNHAIISQVSFVSTRIGKDDGMLDHRIRKSLKHPVSQDYETLIANAVGGALPQILQELGIRPFPISSYEIELVAHGDGGFYHRHIDIFTGGNRSHSGDRVVSCVYYMHSLPKLFSGGALRLYPLPTRLAPAPGSMDVAPEHDTLVAFSSWMPHEVMPTVCPTNQFAHYRFSINCWVYQQSEPAAAQVA